MSLSDAVKTLFASDTRWPDCLAPHHLVTDELSAEDAFRVVPPALWWDVLAWLIQLFPGLVPESCCESYGGTPVGGQCGPLTRASDALAGLIRRSRAMIVFDVRARREMRRVISRCMDRAASA